MNARKENFKLGEFHGKLNPKNPNSEAKLRNDIFLIGKIGLMNSQKDVTNIKIIAKEMPLQENINRGKCIDLFGIDKNWTPYVIELKLGANTEKLTEVIKQVSDYSILFDQLRKNIEVEMSEKLFYKKFRFSGETRKIILSEKEFLGDLKSVSQKYTNEPNMYICSFYKTADIKGSDRGINLLDKKSNLGIVLLGIHNK